MKKANDVGKTDGNHEDDHETDLDVAEEEERDDDHSSDRKAKVTPQLGTWGQMSDINLMWHKTLRYEYEEIWCTYDDISLPTGVYLDMAKIVWRSGFFDHSVHCISEKWSFNL